ncbi:MAG TPA: hypothetical protein VM911_01965 [Pyrinomonadaceae bacterium]|jgi:CRP-like cAMP-binding protein|nr:hypothetical protein [Pyrinomonadaceae bacterium]
MSLQPLPSQRFIRKTQLAPNEYRKNFQQIDREILSAVTSAEADQVTPLMSKIYLRLVNAPENYWEREGVLRIEAEIREEKLVKAWAVLCEMVGVASATASKAIRWMHEQGIIGYFSGKNGVGLRIFLNRAASSIGVRPGQAGKKILAFPPASSEVGHGSANEPAFNDSFAVREVSDTDINPGAPKNGADSELVVKTSSDPTAPARVNSNRHAKPEVASSCTTSVISLDDVVARLKAELEPAIHMAARQAASREHERTREWLEKRGLPKAARVAQHEAYNVLRKYGVISESSRGPGAHADVGRSDYTPPEPHRLSPDEITDMAGVCVAMLETKGQSIELTLSEMSTEAGGFLLQEDAPLVREKANSLLSERKSREGK